MEIALAYFHMPSHFFPERLRRTIKMYRLRHLMSGSNLEQGS